MYGVFWISIFYDRKANQRNWHTKNFGSVCYRHSRTFRGKLYQVDLDIWFSCLSSSVYIMSDWLQDFSYRIELGYGVFLFGIGSTSIVALLTIVLQVYKAAAANPVDVLRDE